MKEAHANAALKLALEALEECRRDPRLKYEHPAYDKTITAIKEALAQDALQALHDENKRLGLYEQEPVAWPCVIETADFEEDTVTLKMQCTDYKISAGKHWLSTTPPQEQPLTDEEIKDVAASCMWWVREQDILDDAIELARAIEAKLKEKNT